MFLNLVVRQQLLQLLVTDQCNLIDFMRRSKTIHKVQKGNTRVERGDLGDCRHIMCLLHTERREHGPSATTDEHRVTVIAVNRERFPGQSAGGDMDHSGKQFTGYFVQIGNVQQESLGSREGSRERS